MNFRKTTWEDAKGQDVWIKLPDGTMEKLRWNVSGDHWRDGRGYSWAPDGAMPRLATPYLQTTEAVEITLPEAVERAEKGLRVVDKYGSEYRWDATIKAYINNECLFFIPAIEPEPEPETVEVTVTLPADLRDDFLKGLSAFAGAKVKE